MAHWYATVYLRVVQAIREHNMLKEFPHRTEADLYLWIMDHLYFSKVQGDDVARDRCRARPALHYSERVDRKLVRTSGKRSSTSRRRARRATLIGTMASEPHPKEKGHR